ncbi:MAG: hypothetical protein GY846_10435 [Deltaproteobacteria bacterium]|nr:hypothetical protein [Deltaproteobacteria bacterium]
MNKFKITCLFFCVLLVIGFSTAVMAAPKVLVVVGTSEAVALEASATFVFGGINDVLKQDGVVPEYMYINFNSMPDVAAKEEAGMAAVAKIKAMNPDLVIVIHDACLKYVGMKIDNIPVVFAYVFAKTASFGLPKSNVTGVTRRSHAADIWGLANQLTGAKTVALMSKRTDSMEGAKKYLIAGADKLEAASGVRYKEMYLVNTFDEWKNAVKIFPEDLIYLADCSRLIDGDRQVPRIEVVAWTVANSTKPVVAGTELDVKGGALYAIVTSERALGAHAGELGRKILKGTAPADLKYVESKEGKLVINSKTAKKYNIEIPYDILSTADKIYE